VVIRFRGGSRPYPALTSELFAGDLSSLRRLWLEYVRIDFPWRNMVNLTSFRLVHDHGAPVLVKQLLDLFESAPHLREVKLNSPIRISSTENGRLVSLAWLKRMGVTGYGSSLPLLDHLLIPAGARLAIWVDLPNHLVEGHPPPNLSTTSRTSLAPPQ